MSQEPIDANTPAWRAQCWISFGVSVGFTLLGIWNLDADLQTRGFFAMGLLFSVSSAFTLAKTIRDDLEASRRRSRGYGLDAERA